MAGHHFSPCYPLVIDPQETGPPVPTGDVPLHAAARRIEREGRVR